MKDLKTKTEESIRCIHWVTSFVLSYIHRYISFGEVGRICRTVFREPMHLCTFVSEEGDSGEAPCSETPSLMSYILRNVSFAEVGRICRAVLREPMHRCTCVSENGGDGEAAIPPMSEFLFFHNNLTSNAIKAKSRWRRMGIKGRVEHKNEKFTFHS
jgi:hypothetical protein